MSDELPASKCCTAGLRWRGFSPNFDLTLRLLVSPLEQGPAAAHVPSRAGAAPPPWAQAPWASLPGSAPCFALSQLQDAPRQVLPVSCPQVRVQTHAHTDQHTGHHWHVPQEQPAAGTGGSSEEQGCDGRLGLRFPGSLNRSGPALAQGVSDLW